MDTRVDIADVATRSLGLGFALVFVLSYDPANASFFNAVPIAALLAGSWLILRNGLAIALAVSLIAAAHSDPGSADPWTGQVYPGVAFTGAVFVLGRLVQRFRHRIIRTRDARWAQRHPG